MTPQQKAKELVEKFSFITGNEHYAKQCALIAVDEWLKMLEGLHKPEYVSFDIYEPKQYHLPDEPDFNGYSMQAYLEQVKEEIENL